MAACENKKRKKKTARTTTQALEKEKEIPKGEGIILTSQIQ